MRLIAQHAKNFLPALLLLLAVPLSFSTKVPDPALTPKYIALTISLLVILVLHFGNGLKIAELRKSPLVLFALYLLFSLFNIVNTTNFFDGLYFWTRELLFLPPYGL
ncbi:MAG: hypothetical protein HC896_11385 [Bacteroidales bacterium]|nr:hypothetical protein [Bacteroidales bacterium]